MRRDDDRPELDVAAPEEEPERRLFDLGSDDGWEPPPGAPKAVLPPWMRPAEEPAPVVAAEEDFAALVAADLAAAEEPVSFGLLGDPPGAEVAEVEAFADTAVEPVAEVAADEEGAAGPDPEPEPEPVPAAPVFEVRRLDEQAVEVPPAEDAPAVKLVVKIPTGGPVWAPPAEPAAPAPAPAPEPAVAPLAPAAAAVPAQANRAPAHRAAPAAPAALQPGFASAVVDVVDPADAHLAPVAGPPAGAAAPEPVLAAVAAAPAPVPVAAGPPGVAPIPIARTPIPAPAARAAVPAPAVPAPAVPAPAVPAPAVPAAAGPPVNRRGPLPAPPVARGGMPVVQPGGAARPGAPGAPPPVRPAGPPQQRTAAGPGVPPSGPDAPRPPATRPQAHAPQVQPPKAPPKPVPMPLAMGQPGRRDSTDGRAERWAEARQGAPRPPRKKLRRTLAALVVLALGGGAGAYVLTSSPGLPPVTDGSAAAQARDWILANAGASATVLAPAASVVDLTDHGTDPTRLVGFHEGSSGPALAQDCCTFLVVSGPAGAKPAHGLPEPVRERYEQSRLVAAFDKDGQHAEVRHILDVGSAGEARDAVDSDRSILAAAGRELADNERLRLSEAARRLLASGDVDPRLQMALIDLTARHVLSVADFPAVPGEDATGTPRRTVAIDRIDGDPIAPGGSRVNEIRDFLAEKKAPYRADLVRTGELGGATVLRVSFRAPTPLGLLASARASER